MIYAIVDLPTPLLPIIDVIFDFSNWIDISFMISFEFLDYLILFNANILPRFTLCNKSTSHFGAGILVTRRYFMVLLSQQAVI
jgi:hypothetical protein